MIDISENYMNISNNEYGKMIIRCESYKNGTYTGGGSEQNLKKLLGKVLVQALCFVMSRSIYLRIRSMRI